MMKKGREDWISPEEVAGITGMSHSRVCQLLRSGKMPGRKTRGQMWEVRRRDAMKFTEAATTGRPRKRADAKPQKRPVKPRKSSEQAAIAG